LGKCPQLIDKPEHKSKITAFKNALRQQQLKYFDSGLLPEVMRLRRATEPDLTLFELVHNRGPSGRIRLQTPPCGLRSFQLGAPLL